MVGGEQVRPVVADDRRAGGDGVKGPLQAGPAAHWVGLRRRGAWPRGAVGGLGEVEQVAPFGVVELESAGDRVEDAGGDAAERAALELGVVLDAHPGQAATSLRRSPGTRRCPAWRQRGLLGSDLGSPRGQELADFGTVVHGDHGTTAVKERCPVGTPINSDFLQVARGDVLEEMNIAARNQTRLPAGAGLVPATVAVILVCSSDQRCRESASTGLSVATSTTDPISPRPATATGRVLLASQQRSRDGQPG